LYKHVLGLDIGSYSLKAVVARGGFGRFEIQRFAAEPLEALELPAQAPDAAAPSLARALSLFGEVHGLAGMDTICALPGHVTSARRLSLPFSDPKKIRRAVPFEVEAQVPYSLEEVVLDYQVLETGTAGADVLAGLARRDLLARHMETLEAGGVDPRILELDSAVLANLAPFLENTRGFVFIMDFGHQKTCLCALNGGKLHSVRTIPFGGHALTLALMEDLRIGRAEAEARKHERGLALLETNCPGFARSLERLVKEVDRTLTAPENVRQGRAERILLAGGGARMLGIAEHLAERLGVPVEPLALKSDERFLWRPTADETPAAAAALALTLRGVLRPPVSSLNLRRDEFAYKRDFEVLRRRFLPTLAIAAALVVLMLMNVITILVKDRREIARLDAQIAKVFRETQPGVTRIIDPLGQMRSGVSDMRRRARALGLYGGNVTALQVLRELSSRVPAGTDVTVTDLSIDENRIRVHGTTPSFEVVDQLKTELEAVPFFREVNVADVKTEREGGKSFNLTITVGAPGVPAAVAPPRARGGA
jgi:type IV pilus assembly protein PilM